MTSPDDPAELGQALEVAFAGRVTIGVPELAALVPMHRETIARHVAAGNLVGRLKGLGRTRHHRVFTIADVRRFLQKIAEDSCTVTSAPSPLNFSVRLGHGMRMIPPKRPAR